jgi:hypothetical protein
MRRERWLIFAFIPALMLLNAFVVLNYTGLTYEPFSWKAFAQSYPPGTGCSDPSQCAPGLFCPGAPNGVCCTTPCDQPGQSCDEPGFEGTCISKAAAPTLSGTGLLIAALLLAAVGGVGLIRNRGRTA